MSYKVCEHTAVYQACGLSSSTSQITAVKPDDISNTKNTTIWGDTSIVSIRYFSRREMSHFRLYTPKYEIDERFRI